MISVSYFPSLIVPALHLSKKMQLSNMPIQTRRMKKRLKMIMVKLLMDLPEVLVKKVLVYAF